MSSQRLPTEQLGPVSSLGELRFEAGLKSFFRGEEIVKLGEAPLRVLWCLMHSPEGVRKEELIAKAWHDGTAGNLHRAVHDIRKRLGFGVVVEEADFYRLNASPLASLPKGKVKHSDLLEGLRANRGRSMQDFIGLFFDVSPPKDARLWSESLVYAADSLALFRMYPEQFAGTLPANRGYILITSPGSINAIPRTLAALYEAIREGAPKSTIDPFRKLRAALTIVITAPQAQVYTPDLYFLNSHHATECTQFLLPEGEQEAVFLNSGEVASKASDSLRARFHGLEQQGLICTPGGFQEGDPLLCSLAAGIDAAFSRFGDAEGKELLPVCIGPHSGTVGDKKPEGRGSLRRRLSAAFWLFAVGRGRMLPGVHW